MRPGFEGNKLAGIQGLRALAAAAVVLLHVADEAGAFVGTPGRSPWRVLDAIPLEAGVDLFFVISGFVMVWASWDQFGRFGAVMPFVWRRLVRIVPLYWLLTAATVFAGLALPGVLSDGLRDGWGYVAASTLFWPWRRMDGSVQPILRLGWTLDYEMLFYTLLACVLPLWRGLALTAVLLALVALAAAGQATAIAWVPLAFWADPIVLEFGFGMVVAVAVRHGWGVGWLGLAVLPVAIIAASLLGNDARVLVRGAPSALLVFCALPWRRLPAWLVLLGDSSYALYLVHPFPMRALRLAVSRLPLPAAWAAPLYLLATLAICVVAAVSLHRWVERPILRWGRRLTSPPGKQRG